MPGDGKITFVEDGHRYTVYGAAIERSCTSVMGAYFAPFDPVANTDEFYEVWKREYEKGNRQHKYYSIIHNALATGGDDEDAAAAIRASWEAKGAEAARLGTLLHLHCEHDLNSEVRQPFPKMATHTPHRTSCHLWE